MKRGRRRQDTGWKQVRLKVNEKATEVLLTASPGVHSTVWPADGAAGAVLYSISASNVISVTFCACEHLHFCLFYYYFMFLL